MPSLACSLSGAGLGQAAAPGDDDPELDAPTGARDAGVDARGPQRTQADAQIADAQPASLDAHVPVPDAASTLDAASALDAASTLDAAPTVDASSAGDGAQGTAQPDAGPTCSLTGSFAARVDFNVGWAPTTVLGLVPVLEGGQGTLSMFASVRFAAGGATVIEPCGAAIPDFEGTPTIGGELYGGEIPNAAWDAPAMPSFDTLTTFDCAQPGCGYAAAKTTMVIGARAVGSARVWPAPGGWSESGEYAAQDDDGDGRPGLTMSMRGPTHDNSAGRPYAYPPLGIAQYGRAHKLLVALSVRMRLEGSLTSCDRIDGTSIDSDVHVSAVGCTGVLDGESKENACAPELAQIVDANFPLWSVQSAGFTMLRLPAGADCAATRAALRHSGRD